MRSREPGGDVVLGVDFTSAPSAWKPLTITVGRLVDERRQPQYCLDDIRELDRLEGWIARVPPGPS